MEEKNRTCTVKYIPASPCVVLSEMVKYELLKCVPYGRLTTDTAMRKYLAKIFEIPRVEFERDYSKLAEIVSDAKLWGQYNSHREVSDSGIIEPGCEDKLRAEGFELIPSARSKGNLQVKDFKKYLFDFEKECPLTMEKLAEYQINRRTLGDL